MVRIWAPPSVLELQVESPVALPPSFYRAEAPRGVRQPVNFLLPGIVRPQGGSRIAPTWQVIAQIGPRRVRTEPTIAWPIGPTA